MGKDMAWMQAMLFMSKVLWIFDLIKVPDQNMNFEGKLYHYGFFVKPEVKVRFVQRRL